MDDTVLERIETRIAYLENANQELSDSVYRQQIEIETLRSQIATWQQRLESWTAEQAAMTDERPPHY